MSALHDAVTELLHVAAGHKNLTSDEANALIDVVDADAQPAPAAEPEPAPEPDTPAPGLGGDEARGFHDD